MLRRKMNLKLFIEKKRYRWILLFFPAIFVIGGVLMLKSSASEAAMDKVDGINRISSPANYKKGRFVNSIRAADPKILEVMVEWITGKGETKPKKPIPIIKQNKSFFSQLPSSGLRITWLGHSTTLVEIDGKRLLLDPVFSDRSSPFTWAGPKRFFDPPLPLADMPQIDAVLISHDHYDHLDKTTITELGQKDTRFVVPLGVAKRLEKWGVSEKNIVELNWWESLQLGPLSITATPARHFSGRSIIMADRNKTLWTGFSIHGPKHRVYYSGDTGMFEGFKEIGQKLGPFDVTLIEAGAYHRLWADLHLGPEQALAAHQQVRGKMMIPVHWGTFELALHGWTEPAERLLAAAEKEGISIALPKSGQSVEPATPPRLVKWWPNIPWQTAKEHPVVSSGLEYTSERQQTPRIQIVNEYPTR